MAMKRSTAIPNIQNRKEFNLINCLGVSFFDLVL